MRLLVKLRALGRRTGALLLFPAAVVAGGLTATWLARGSAFAWALWADILALVVVALWGFGRLFDLLNQRQKLADRYRQELDRQTRLLDTLLDRLPIRVYFKDSLGRFTRVNESMADRLGLMDPSEAVGRSHGDFFEPGYVENVLRMEEQVQATGQALLHREELEGSEELGDAWISVSRFPLSDTQDGSVLLCIAQDMTARKFTEQALEGANAQLTNWVSELEQQSDQTVLLSEMGEMLQTCIDEEEATTIINRYAQNLFSSGSGVLAVLKPSHSYVEAVAAWGSSTTSEYIFQPEQCWALRRGRPHAMAQGDQNVRCNHVLADFNGSALCVPMMAQGEALGVLHISLPEHAGAFTKAQLRLATTFSERVGLAFANLKLREQLRSQSVRDPLTGLFNRRYMEESLEREIRRASRHEKPVAALMIDLDHFKRFNDTFGHEAGDMLLREFGAIARGFVRKEDIACRYGGEEFLLIMPDAPLEVALSRADDIRRAVKELELKSSGRAIGKVTASIGVAMFPEHAQTVDTLVRAADTALYEAKHGGRDRVVLAVETYA